jgi:hypothetical protein
MAKPLEKVARSFTLLLIAVVCFQVGRWYGELETSAKAVHDPAGIEMVKATFRGAPEPVKTIEPVPGTAAGDPVGQSTDIITPLNVRDPSALVMGPSASYQLACPPPAIAPAVPERAKTLKPLKAGKLLELLKRAEKKSDAPKSF